MKKNKLTLDDYVAGKQQQLEDVAEAFMDNASQMIFGIQDEPDAECWESDLDDIWEGCEELCEE